MQRYKHIYIDLDRTLWDFGANSAETLKDLYSRYGLDEVFPSFAAFHKSYEKNNSMLWDMYLRGEMKKEVLRTLRFDITLNEFGLSNSSMARDMGEDYIVMSGKKTILFPYVYQSLEYLRNKYSLHIITNGFNEVQFAKLRNSRLDKYFTTVITSEDAGFMKPRAGIFHYALARVNARKIESIMIGDDLETDIRGAMNAGIDQVYFNPEKIPHNEFPSYEISSLKELTRIF